MTDSDRPVALVSGASRGIGRSLCEHLLRRGYTVVGCSRTACDLEAEGFSHVQADVTEEAQVTRLVRGIGKGLGRLDVLLNNAGAASMNHILLTPASTAQNILNVNVLGTFLMSREAAKLMRRRRYGRIVNFGSAAVPVRLAGEAVYVASKSGVVALSQTMARELADLGITVNVVGPAPTETDMIRGVPKDKIQRFLDDLPIKRLTTFQDIAHVVDFFLSDASEAVTAQVMYLNGMPNL